MTLLNFVPVLFRRNELNKSEETQQNRVTRSEISALFAQDLGYQRPLAGADKSKRNAPMVRVKNPTVADFLAA